MKSAELRELRADVKVLRLMPSIKKDTFCQLLIALVDALEVEVARPYDHDWNHTIPMLAARLGLDGCHPANVISQTIVALDAYEVAR